MHRYKYPPQCSNAGACSHNLITNGETPACHTAWGPTCRNKPQNRCFVHDRWHCPGTLDALYTHRIPCCRNNATRTRQLHYCIAVPRSLWKHLVGVTTPQYKIYRVNERSITYTNLLLKLRRHFPILKFLVREKFPKCRLGVSFSHSFYASYRSGGPSTVWIHSPTSHTRGSTWRHRSRAVGRRHRHPPEVLPGQCLA